MASQKNRKSLQELVNEIGININLLNTKYNAFQSFLKNGNQNRDYCCRLVGKVQVILKTAILLMQGVRIDIR